MFDKNPFADVSEFDRELLLCALQCVSVETDSGREYDLIRQLEALRTPDMRLATYRRAQQVAHRYRYWTGTLSEYEYRELSEWELAMLTPDSMIARRLNAAGFRVEDDGERLYSPYDIPLLLRNRPDIKLVK